MLFNSNLYTFAKQLNTNTMGGWTAIRLKDTSRHNIDVHNAKLETLKVNKKYRFYSEYDTIVEYEFFKIGVGAWDERFFPKDKIKSYNDFKKYWSSEALGEVFVPNMGTLTLDVYFGRTPKKTMRKIGKYFMQNIDAIKEVDGSSWTFFERCFTKAERQICR